MKLPGTRVTFVVLMITAGAERLRAQPSPPPAATPATRYADYTFGFELELSREWAIDRTRFRIKGGGAGVLRGSHIGGTRSLQIAIYKKPATLPFSVWMRAQVRRLSRIEGTQRVGQTERDLSDRIAALLDIEAEISGAPTRRYALYVPFDETTVWVFSLALVAAGDAQIEPALLEFETACSTLKILHTEQEQARLAEALERGRKLVSTLERISRRAQIEQFSQHYEVRTAAGPVGYLWLEIGPHVRREGAGRISGIRARERSLRFLQSGAASLTRVYAFVSFDTRTELIETQITQFPPPQPGGGIEGALIKLDQCIREGGSLYSSYSRSDQPDQAHSRIPVTIGPVYLPLAWFRLLPALLGTQAGDEHAFVMYDAEIRGMTTQRIRALGEGPLPGDASKRVFAYELREGYAPYSATIYTDEGGRMVRYVAGEYELRTVSPAIVEQRFGARQRALERRAKP